MLVQKINTQMTSNRSHSKNNNSQPSFGYNVKGMGWFIREYIDQIDVKKLEELRDMAKDEATKHINIDVECYDKQISRLVNKRRILIGISDTRYPLARTKDFYDDKKGFGSAEVKMGLVPIFESVSANELVDTVINAARKSKILAFVDNIIKPSHKANQNVVKEFENFDNLMEDKKFLAKVGENSESGVELLSHNMTKFSRLFARSEWNGNSGFSNRNISRNFKKIIESGFDFSADSSSKFSLGLGEAKKDMGPLETTRLLYSGLNPLNFSCKKFDAWLKEARVELEAQNELIQIKQKKDNLLVEIFGY